jgi:(2Fe-2S) ferredoxin
MARYEKHIFICENKRDPSDPRGCCAEKDSLVIRDLFKKRLKELGLNKKMRANGTGCLDACAFGPSIVVYPEQIWYGGVKVEDVEEIIQNHLIHDKPVERLLIKEKKFLGDE